MSKGLSINACSVRDAVEVMTRLGPRRGSAAMRRLLASRPAPTRTVVEDLVLDLIVDGGIGRPDVNRPLFIEGRRLIPDFRWPGLKLIVEADSRAWHDNQLAARTTPSARPCWRLTASESSA